MKLEICVDSLESLETAVAAGADRIELCASLAEGGLTPSMGLVEVALRTSVPVFVMIRPRACDFLYTAGEIEVMLRDINGARWLGVPGVVLGVLTDEGTIDEPAMRSLKSMASGMEITCHRAVDQTRDPLEAVETLARIGIDRVLTSGQEETPGLGIETLAAMVKTARGRLSIMAAGVTPEGVREVVERTGVDEVHSAAAATRASAMSYVKDEARMGRGDDFAMTVVDGAAVRAIKTALAGG